MEHCTDSYELLALNANETTTDESEINYFVKRRQNRRKRCSRTPAINQSLISSSTKGYNWVSKCCWHVLCLFFIGNLLWIFGLTWAATQLRTDMQALKNITEKA